MKVTEITDPIGVLLARFVILLAMVKQLVKVHSFTTNTI
jgi:hypothetical protein